MMSYEQVVSLALHYGLTKDQAEEFAMAMYLQEIKDKDFIESALRMKILK